MTPLKGEMASRAIARAEAIAAGVTDEKKQAEWVRDNWWTHWIRVSVNHIRDR